MGWMAAAIAAVLLVGGVIYAMSDRTKTATNPAVTTTGQSDATISDPATPPMQKEQAAPVQPVTPKQ